MEPGSAARHLGHMAQHGGQTSLPRTHRPRAPIMSVPVPITAPLAPLRPPPPVSLSSPRPESERAVNEYVEAPFRPSPPTPPRPIRPDRLHLPHPPPPPITKQPETATFSKDPPPECASRLSIMCPECGRCRCNSCQQPRPLPQRWICNEACLCSADTIIDYASCLCCAKAFFYHCSETDGGETCADDPCGCNPERRTARWGCLAALTCVLPCFLLYWPLQVCKSAVETCYARHSRQGCRCRPPLTTPEKRLLDSSSDF